MAAMRADAPLQELLESLDVSGLWAWQHKVCYVPRRRRVVGETC